MGITPTAISKTVGWQVGINTVDKTVGWHVSSNTVDKTNLADM